MWVALYKQGIWARKVEVGKMLTLQWIHPDLSPSIVYGPLCTTGNDAWKQNQLLALSTSEWSQIKLQIKWNEIWPGLK